MLLNVVISVVKVLVYHMHTKDSVIVMEYTRMVSGVHLDG